MYVKIVLPRCSSNGIVMAKIPFSDKFWCLEAINSFRGYVSEHSPAQQ